MGVGLGWAKARCAFAHTSCRDEQCGSVTNALLDSLSKQDRASECQCNRPPHETPGKWLNDIKGVDLNKDHVLFELHLARKKKNKKKKKSKKKKKKKKKKNKIENSSLVFLNCKRLVELLE